MKKIVLSLLVVGSLLTTSCKKAAKEAKESVNATENAVKEAANKVEEVIDEHSADMADPKEVAAVKKLDAAIAVAKGLGVEIPSFDKPELTQNLADYAVYAKDYLAAKGNVATISKLAPKGAELISKGKELLKGVDAETVNKYTSVLTSLQSKMAPAK